MVLTPQAEDDNTVDDDDAKNRSRVEPIEDGVDIPITCHDIKQERKAGPNTTNYPQDHVDDPGVPVFTEDTLLVVEWAGDSYKSVQGKNEDVDNRGLRFI